ncbi:MAG: glycoside hydrolase family 127 protein [Clostridia bacterium]|nr:glycoside hydrolase family 127 protein [Clostridia bacterium]
MDKIKKLIVDSVVEEKGLMSKAIRFVIENQMKDRVTWGKNTEVFTTREDSDEARWRGEFFGKQMRGAALVYTLTKDEELYDILTETVLSLLDRQDEYGRFSTYTVETEFNGWDMWCRKYVLVGMMYYHEICKDEALKERIINACCRHLDYVVAKIGDGEGQKSITATSEWWGCVNSCTILEPTIELYKRTGREDYLRFAEYIISKGGCSDCNLIELALQDEIAPYQYPVTKAYEMMSFYEGLVAYYEVTGEKKYLDATSRFIEAVAKTDITIIGCAGCTHELFDNSAVMQTEFHENIMQETCVAVTWMRVLRRLYQLTGEAKYIDRIEQTGYNTLYGSLNTELNEQWNMWEKIYYEAKCFDSYSPLYMNKRGRGIGGQMPFASGGYNGCCVAIGACGIALMPMTTVMQGADSVYVNMLFNGSAQVQDANGNTVTLQLESAYPANGNGTITVNCQDTAKLTLKIRKPAWCEDMTVNGAAVKETGYYTLAGEYKNGDKISISMQTPLKAHYLNEKIAFTYGALTLATDEQKSDRTLEKPVNVGNELTYTVEQPKGKDELVRIVCKLEDGDELLLTDYQSCGKKWKSDKPRMTVWFNTKE